MSGPADPYTFQAEPRAVSGARSKYRPGEPMNIMSDPRVHRGSTYSALHRQQPAQQAPARDRPVRRRQGPQGWKSKSIFDYQVPKRERRGVDLSPYLVEQAARPGASDSSTQTDRFVDLPPPEPYVPAKTGVDSGTQLDHRDGLFDFDAESALLLDVLTSKTVEQAVLELQQEAELRRIAERLSEFRAACEEEARRLVAEESRVRDDARQRDQALQQRRQDAEARRRSAQDAAVAASKQRERDEEAARLAALAAAVDPVKELIGAEFLPDVVSRVVGSCQRLAAADAEVDRSIARALEKARALAPRGGARKGSVRLTVARSALGLEGGGEVQVGPIPVDATTTVPMVEAQIRAFLEAEGVCAGERWPEGLLERALGVDGGGDVALLDAELPRSSKVLVELD